MRHGQVNHILDLIITDYDANDVRDIEFLPPVVKSDHCVLKFKICTEAYVSSGNNNSIPTVKKLNFNKGKYLEMRHCLENMREKFEEVILSNSLDDVLNNYIDCKKI